MSNPSLVFHDVSCFSAYSTSCSDVWVGYSLLSETFSTFCLQVFCSGGSIQQSGVPSCLDKLLDETLIMDWVVSNMPPLHMGSPNLSLRGRQNFLSFWHSGMQFLPSVSTHKSMWRYYQLWTLPVVGIWIGGPYQLATTGTPCVDHCPIPSGFFLNHLRMSYITSR